MAQTLEVTVPNILSKLEETPSADIKAHELAPKLGVPEGTLGKIQRDHSKDESRQLYEVLKYFVNNHPHKTAWKTLKDALRKINQPNAAEKIDIDGGLSDSKTAAKASISLQDNNDPRVEVDHSDPSRKRPAAHRTIADSDDPVTAPATAGHGYNWWKLATYILAAILSLICAFFLVHSTTNTPL